MRLALTLEHLLDRHRLARHLLRDGEDLIIPALQLHRIIVRHPKRKPQHPLLAQQHPARLACRPKRSPCLSASKNESLQIGILSSQSQKNAEFGKDTVHARIFSVPLSIHVYLLILLIITMEPRN